MQTLKTNRVSRFKPRDPGSSARVSRDKNFVALTSKVFGILEAFSENPHKPISLEEVTAHVGLAKSTVHRLLYSMKKIGYIEQNESTGEYLLGAKFFDLGRAVLP